MHPAIARAATIPTAGSMKTIRPAASCPIPLVRTLYTGSRSGNCPSGVSGGLARYAPGAAMFSFRTRYTSGSLGIRFISTRFAPEGRSTRTSRGTRGTTEQSRPENAFQHGSLQPIQFQESHPKNRTVTPKVSMNPWARMAAQRFRPDRRYAAPRISPATPESTIPAGPL